MNLSITTPAALEIVNKGLDQGHRFRQHPELGKSKHHVPISPCTVVATLIYPGTVLVIAAASVKDPRMCLQAS